VDSELVAAIGAAVIVHACHGSAIFSILGLRILRLGNRRIIRILRLVPLLMRAMVAVVEYFFTKFEYVHVVEAMMWLFLFGQINDSILDDIMVDPTNIVRLLSSQYRKSANIYLSARDVELSEMVGFNYGVVVLDKSSLDWKYTRIAALLRS
jgi:hypothetical protein